VTPNIVTGVLTSRVSARSRATGMLIRLPSSAPAMMMAIQPMLMPMRW